MPFFALGVLFWVFFYIGAYKALSFIRGIDAVGEALSKRLLHMTCFSLMGFLALSSVITSISSFYLSRDLQFLVSSAARTRDILRLKTAETVLVSSWMAFSFVPPVFLAYGVSYGAPPSYYAISLLSFTLLIFITAGAGIAVSHLLTRVFPAKGAKDFLYIAGLLIFVVLYVIARSGAGFDASDPLGLIEGFFAIRTDSPLLPSYWMTEAVFPSGENRFFYLFILLSNALFFLLVSERTGRRLFPKNFEALQSHPSGAKRAARGAFFMGQSAAVALKDLKVFIRDRGQWSQLVIIGAIAFVYVFNFTSIPVDAVSAYTPIFREIIAGLNLLMAGLVLTAVAARFLYSSVSLEGQAFWVIRASPVGMRGFLLSKFLSGTLFVAVLTASMVFLTNSAMKAGHALTALSLFLTVILSISVGGLATGLGALSPKFKYENIASVSMSAGGMSFMLSAFALVVLSISSAAWPYYLYMRAGSLREMASLEILEAAGSLVFLFSVNLAALCIPMRLGIKKLERLEI